MGDHPENPPDHPHAELGCPTYDPSLARTHSGEMKSNLECLWLVAAKFLRVKILVTVICRPAFKIHFLYKLNFLDWHQTGVFKEVTGA